MSHEPEDDRWIARFLDGDPSAFDSLVRKHAGWATRFAMRLLGTAEAAEDAVQESFVRVYRSLAGFRGTATFRTYLYRVVLNCCRDVMARRKREEAALADLHERGVREERDRTGDADDPRVELSRRELAASVEQQIEALPRAQRETLILRVHEGLSYREIGDLLGVSLNAVKGNLAAARARLAATALGRGKPARDSGAGGQER